MKLSKFLPVLLLGSVLACQKPTDAINPGNPSPLGNKGCWRE
ncbi:hypothetical protein [Spirosoma sp. KCTC 42546]|nr:hypothetical protein [Spirosoma sp. KCTC 42546]